MKTVLVGVDDSGRGALAGALVLCAFTHPDPGFVIRAGATDSKRTTRAAREGFRRRLLNDGRGAWALGGAVPQWVEAVGLDAAEASVARTILDDLLFTKLELGVNDLSSVHVDVDGAKSYPSLPPELSVAYVPRADADVVHVAAASVLARLQWDELVDDVHRMYPDWGFNVHGGYDDQEGVHARMLYDHGPLFAVHHRRSATKVACAYARSRGLPLPTWLNEVEEIT